MTEKRAFVTGASGFIGRHVVRALLNRNYNVRAGVRDPDKISGFFKTRNLEIAEIDICNKKTLEQVFTGVDELYHFAATVNGQLPFDRLSRVNAAGTQNVWEAAGRAGVKKTLYCSTTSVYGLLAGGSGTITEGFPPRAVEPYGQSKLAGEKSAAEVSKAWGMKLVIIRPTAVFGPGDNTRFGRSLREAAYTKLLLSGGFQKKRFSFVHVQDVAEAAIHLMTRNDKQQTVYNIAVDRSISYEDAFRIYIGVLEDAGNAYFKLRILARIASQIEKLPGLAQWLCTQKKAGFVFGIWKPGFDLTFSSEKLLSTGYRFHWHEFEDAIASCLCTRT